MSTQKLALVDLAVKTKFMLDSIDNWILTQPSLINARRRALLPVVRERQQLSDALSKYECDVFYKASEHEQSDGAISDRYLGSLGISRPQWECRGR